MNNTKNNTSLRMYLKVGPLPEAPGASLPAGLTMLIWGWFDVVAGFFYQPVYFYSYLAVTVYRNGINGYRYLPLEFKIQTKMANANGM
jgi:hypothetical protein